MNILIYVAVKGQKYSTTTKYPCTDCAIYRLNIQLEPKMGIVTYSNRPKVFQHHQISMYRLCHLSTKESVGTKMGI